MFQLLLDATVQMSVMIWRVDFALKSLLIVTIVLSFENHNSKVTSMLTYCVLNAGVVKDIGISFLPGYLFRFFFSVTDLQPLCL